MLSRFFGLASLILGLAAPPLAQAADCTGAIARVRPFLESYGRGDAAAVLALVEPDVVIFGSDVAERFEGAAGVRRMLTGDQALWRGQGRIGAPEGLAAVGGEKLCVLTFQAPFTLGPRPPITVRFTMTWRKTAQGWRLAQSANAVPTVGQSAEALLRGG